MPTQDIPNRSDMTVLEQMNQDLVGVVWDRGEPNSVKGLHLRIFSSGKRCFYFYYVAKHGIRKRPKIGEGLKLSEARKIAGEMRAKVLLGIDPRGVEDGRQLEKTIGDVFTRCRESYWSLARFQVSGRLREVDAIWNGRIQNHFQSRKLSELRTPELRTWHLAMSGTPTMANRALEVLSRIYSYAIENEWAERNPCLSVKAFPEAKRKRVPTKDELKRILTHLFIVAKDPDDRQRYAAIFILGLFYTGARPTMLVDVKWEHRTLTVGEGARFELKGKMSYKNDENETLFIPRQVLELLHLYERRPDGKVFTTKGTRGLWESMTKDLQINNLWKRDARKAFASLGLNAGVSIDKVGLALNHKSASTTKIYAQEFDNSTIETTLIVAGELDEILK